MTKVIHIKDAPPGWKNIPDFVYIGRGSRWGNPYRIGDKHQGQVIDRNLACELFEKNTLERLLKSDASRVREGRVPFMRQLKGKTLVCFCKPLRCHGDILAAIVDEMY